MVLGGDLETSTAGGAAAASAYVARGAASTAGMMGAKSTTPCSSKSRLSHDIPTAHFDVVGMFNAQYSGTQAFK